MNFRFKGILAIFIFCLYSSILEAKTYIVVNPHDYSNEDYCSECHLNKGPKLIDDPTGTCIRCHPNNERDHVIDIIPKMGVPPDLPLTNEDEMTCYTCHDYHNRLKLEYMLWVDYANLCASCHVRH